MVNCNDLHELGLSSDDLIKLFDKVEEEVKFAVESSVFCMLQAMYLCSLAGTQFTGEVIEIKEVVSYKGFRSFEVESFLDDEEDLQFPQGNLSQGVLFTDLELYSTQSTQIVSEMSKRRESDQGAFGVRSSGDVKITIILDIEGYNPKQRKLQYRYDELQEQLRELLLGYH